MLADLDAARVGDVDPATLPQWCRSAKDAVWGGEAAARINLSRGFSRITCLSRPLPPSRRPCPLRGKAPGDGMPVGVPL